MMNPAISTVLMAAALLGGGSTICRADCQNVTIASMNWQSAELESAVDKAILTDGYGCSVNVIVGDTVPTITSMVEKGEPDLIPEGAIDLLPDLINKGVQDGKVILGAKTIQEGTIIGIYIPKYVAEAHPEIKTFADALKHPDLFPDPEEPGKGAVYNGPQGWGQTVNTAQLFKAYKGGQAGFELIDPGSAAGLDGSLIKAYEHKRGWLGTYWSPSSLLGRYPMVRLDVDTPVDEGEWKRCTTKADCPDPKPTGWPAGRDYLLMSAPFVQRAPADVLKYLHTRTFSTADLEGVMGWMTDNQATGDDGAQRFLKQKEDVWSKWVPADVAARIKAAVNG